MTGALVSSSLTKTHGIKTKHIISHKFPNVRENIRTESQKTLRESTCVKVRVLQFERGRQAINVTSGARSHDS